MKIKKKTPLLDKFKKRSSAKQMVENVLSVEEVAEKYFKQINKSHIEKYVKNLRDSEVEDFKKLFNAIKSGLRLTGRIYHGVDKGGNAYRYIKFFSPKGEIECKFFPLGKIDLMIADYQSGKIHINFTAVHLVEHLFNR